MEWFQRAIHGQEPLWRVFWVYGLLLLALFAGCYFIAGDFFASFAAMFPPYGGWLLVIMSTIAVSLWLLMVWDCAAYVGMKIWFYLARLLVICSVLIMVCLWLLLLGFPPALWLWYMSVGRVWG